MLCQVGTWPVHGVSPVKKNDLKQFISGAYFMKIRTLTSLLMAGGMTALMAESALATPTIYPKTLTFLSAIENPTNSNLVADDADPRVIWVMPPNTATSKVEGLHTLTANVGYCQEMADLQGYSATM